MSQIQPLRPLGIVTDLKSVAKLVADMDYNLQLLYRQSPQTLPDVPGSGQLGFLVQNEDGTWETWRLVAGAGVTFTPNVGAKTLTVSSP